MSSSLFLLFVCSRKYLMSIVFLKYTLLKKLEMVSKTNVQASMFIWITKLKFTTGDNSGFTLLHFKSFVPLSATEGDLRKGQDCLAPCRIIVACRKHAHSF